MQSSDALGVPALGSGSSSTERASSHGTTTGPDVVADQQLQQQRPPVFTMAVVASRPATASRRSIRSREGCSTCKRRKVKCDEQRPRCSHCERLNLECKWRPQSSAHHRRQASTAQNPSQHSPVPPSPATDGSPGGSATQQAHAVDEVFDYASFMWDSGDFWQQVSPLLTTANPALSVAALPGAAPATQGVSDPRPDEAPAQSMLMPPPQLPADEDRLMDFFARSDNPPVLAEVETQNKWLAMRQAVVDMARVSPVVRSAILAFSNVLVVRCEGPWAAVSQVYYDNAIRELAATAAGSPREHLVAALFFLAYVDILESRIDAAHSHLNRAYSVYELADRGSLGHVEKQFFLWFRILDGRAVSAGGDGPFLSKETELMLTEASPASQSLEGEGASTGANADEGGPGGDDLGDGDLEAVLFQVLYQPGIVFYQKVQSFMGRISKIDPWHRSRGTVEDETEVMNVAAEIAADLRSLHDQRPPLMDYAVAGRLTERHVSAHLAFAITRSFRTYLSNYYASKVHLHRVAYKTLPLTREALDALASIRRLARRLVADLAAPDDALPVNMLWPLLMLGVEEQDPEEKAWIRAQILRMEKVASNARITAQVLEEVQARQDAARARMDIRSVMIAVFNSVFAIV